MTYDTVKTIIQCTHHIVMSEHINIPKRVASECSQLFSILKHFREYCWILDFLDQANMQSVMTRGKIRVDCRALRV